MRTKRILWMSLFAAALVAVVGRSWWLESYPAPAVPSELADRALLAGKPEERINAVVELAMLNHPDATPQLTQVLEESAESQVVIEAIHFLVARADGKPFEESLLQRLRQKLKTADPRVKAEILTVLAQQMDGKSWDLILKELHHPDFQFSYAARRAFQRLAGLGDNDIGWKDKHADADAQARFLRGNYPGTIDPISFEPDRRKLLQAGQK